MTIHNPQYSINEKHGFTLVELSIVLVIIGLLISGILVGQSLIDSTKVVSQIKQIEQYDIAISQFKTKFGQIPGDSSLNLGCIRGDNNGYLNFDGDPNRPPASFRGDTVCFWKHLSASKMITEDYVYSGGTGGTSFSPGIHYPLSKINTRAGMYTTGMPNGDIYYVLGSEKFNHNQNFIHSMVNYVGIMHPNTALSIDTKLDNSAPSTGSVVSIREVVPSAFSDPYPFVLNTSGAVNACTTGGTRYNTNATESYCRILVRSGYNK